MCEVGGPGLQSWGDPRRSSRLTPLTVHALGDSTEATQLFGGRVRNKTWASCFLFRFPSAFFLAPLDNLAFLCPRSSAVAPWRGVRLSVCIDEGSLMPQGLSWL